MNDLDEKLKEVLVVRHSSAQYYTLNEREIEQIKQAFIDAGWNPPVTDEAILNIITKMGENQKEVMPGQEWYDRFEVELHKKGQLAFAGIGVVREAAKKAAGLE